MAEDLHAIQLTGRCARDPELAHTASGTAVLKIRLAYSSQRKDQGGNWTDKSNFIDVVMWGNRAEAVAKYLSKGSRIAVWGRIEWREWEAQDGTKRQSYEVNTDGIVFLDPKGSAGGGEQSSFSGGGGSSSGPSDPGSFEPAAGPGPDDDIPF